MFRRLPDLVADESLTVSIDGRPFTARRGDSVAATLLAAGLDACRTTAVKGVARGPWCMMGVCFDCLIVIDGQPNRQGCMVAIEDGMRIEMQRGARAVAAAAVAAVASAAAAVEADAVDAAAVGAGVGNGTTP